MTAFDLITDCAICGAMGKGDWCGDDREEPDSPSWLCPCEAAYSRKNMVAMMERMFASTKNPQDGDTGGGESRP